MGVLVTWPKSKEAVFVGEKNCIKGHRFFKNVLPLQLALLIRQATVQFKKWFIFCGSSRGKINANSWL